MPRSRTEDTGETVVDQLSVLAVGSRFWRRLVVHHSSSVFLVLSWSQLDCIQSATSLTHPDNVDEKSSLNQLSTSAVRSATYRMNKTVPSTEPCGTQQIRGTADDRMPLQQTNCLRPDRYDRNQCLATSAFPKLDSIRCRKMPWSSVSNAADRSRRTRGQSRHGRRQGGC